jgi:ketosteroid isomerase-like protein
VSEVSFHPSSHANFIDRLPLAFTEGDNAAGSKAEESANVRLLQEQYRALARGDFGPVLALMAEDVELEMLGPPDVPLSGCWRGRHEVAEAVRRNFGLLQDQQAELLAVVAQGDTVVLHARERGRYRPTGKAYQLHWVQFFTFRAGQLVRLRSLCDTAALRAAAEPAGVS